MDSKLYIEVILPVPFQTFTYSVPQALQSKINTGCLVLVEFGKNKHYSGLVSFVHQLPVTRDFEIKDILAIENTRPILRRPQLRFWEWLSEYYLCRLGEVYKAVLPSGFRTESSSNYKPKTEIYIQLTSFYSEEDENLQKAFDQFKRSEKQEKLLLAFIDYSHALSSVEKREVSRKELLSRSGISESVLTGLINKGILEIYEKEISRLNSDTYELASFNQLNKYQQQAYGEIVRSFREKDVCLLHGVTSAGKTEIYIQLINETLKIGRQVLFLLPEIALTSQITGRLKKVFGSKMGIYHSKINDNERVEIWNNLLDEDSYQIILGVRSSIFLPFKDLGLIIVDEEHETGYKQQDPAPRYHARNAAIVLGTMHGGKILLGSATPSLESSYNARIGKYGHVILDKRFEEIELPEITPVNIKELRRKKKMKGLFSPLLIEKMQKILENEEQVILFQNRRGFAPMIFCKDCDWVPKCKYCDVSLSYHKKNDKLVCHYCASAYPIPTQCPECGNTDLRPKGFGTEKVEEEILKIFPDIKVGRMDADTTKNKTAHEDIIKNFEKGKTQVLVGTQMVSKGFDFSNVSLVGILNADSMMNFPDFRAHERAFQLMSQVAGRAGRRKKRGEVVLQTSHPEYPLIEQILHNNYEGMYQFQMEERQLFGYPPFYRIIEITIKHKQEDIAREYAGIFTDKLRDSLGNRLLGPYKPLIGKIQTLHIRKLMLKIEVSASLSNLRKILEDAQLHMSSIPAFKYVILQYDVDPV